MRVETEHGYSGWRLVDPGAVLQSLARRGIVPVWNVDCDHVTRRYPDDEVAPWPRLGLVALGHVIGDGVEAILVSVDGTIFRPYGGIYHLTLSVADGYEAREANDLWGPGGPLVGQLHVFPPFTLGVAPF